jgi:hypothetical protein
MVSDAKEFEEVDKEVAERVAAKNTTYAHIFTYTYVPIICQ